MRLLLLSCLLLATLHAMGDDTRGIGQYPGAKEEFFGPTVEWMPGSGQQTNVALHRAAYASSAIDYNHTAHLVTDGICNADKPATLTVTTPQGRLPRREAEWSIDGGPYSHNLLMGSSTWLQYDLSESLAVHPRRLTVQGMVAYDDTAASKGYTLSCQASDDGEHWRTVGMLSGTELPGTPLHYKLHSDPNKQEEENLLPARVLSEEIRLDGLHQPTTHLRVVMEMEGAAHWDIRELTFADASGEYVEVMPSRAFSSQWISAGGGEQWIYVDLGRTLPVEGVKLSWQEAPRKGSIQTSDDAVTWRTVGSIEDSRLAFTGRYVRLLLQEPGDAGYYALREMEVLSPYKVVYTPHAPAPAGTARQTLSGGGWWLQRASEVSATGEEISSAGFAHDGWVTATVPGTVLASYLNIGAVPNPNYADNVDEISESFFRSNFWYCGEFEVGDILNGQQQWLNFDGINWKAEVYLNGHHLGRIEGAFMRGRFNVTGMLRHGTNHLAVEIICNEHFAAIKEKDTQTTQYNGGILGADNPTFHATVGWDWITTVRGREAGIWNEVWLSATGMVTLSDPYVQTTLSDATTHVTPSVFVRNNASHPVSGTLSGWIGDVRFEKQLTLPANMEQEVTFCPDSYSQLASKDLRLWWPNGYGEPYLYDAGYSFTPQGGEAETISYKAGLREMRYVDAVDSLRIYVNGRRFIPLGGNWGFDEHNLLYRSREYDVAVRYHRDMHFTMIRNWVGQVADEAFYEACDRHGIMVWQDFWLANPADGPDPYDNMLFLRNAEDYTRRMRQHASIGLYCGRNEGFPPESLDRKLREYVHQLAPGMEYISHSSKQGVSGGGPYRALPMKEYYEKQSGKIHSERGMPNVMNIESLHRTFSDAKLWPQSLEWGQHDFTLQGAQRGSTYNKMMNDGFGQAKDAEEYSRWAQLINYNGYRVLFESTSKSRAGLLLWMSHACWPSMVWQTYDYYFDPTAAYFGCKKACEPLHIQYNALTDSIEVVNHSAGNRKAVTATVAVYDLSGKRTSQKKMTMDSAEDSTRAWITLAKVMPAAPSDVYFVRLTLADRHGVISENTYIMGREEGNYHALAALPKADVEQKTTIEDHGDSSTATVVLRNKGKVPAPFLRLNLKGADGEQILPALYSDNYITLMPGEQKTVTVSWQRQDARGQQGHIAVTTIQ